MYGFVVHTFFLDGIASEYEALSAVSTTDWMVETQVCKLKTHTHDPFVMNRRFFLWKTKKKKARASPFSRLSI